MPSAANSPRDAGPPSWLWLVLGALVLGGGIFLFLASSVAGAASRNDDGVATRDTAPLVEVSTAAAAPLRFTVRAPGRLEPRQQLAVVGEVSGKIVEVSPKLTVGGRFDTGEVLFRINPSDYRAQLEQAEAALETARANLARAKADTARQKELAEDGFAPQSVVDTAVAGLADARAAVEQAEAQVRIARNNLAKTVVRSPFPALVLSEDVSLDTYVAPGSRLAELMDASVGEIEAGLTPTDVAAVRRAAAETPGEPVNVRAVPNEGSLGSAVLEGRLDSFAPAIDPASRTVSVVAVFPDAFSRERDGEIFAGDFMTLEIEGLADRRLFEVPTAAIRRNAMIWAVDTDSRLQRVDIDPVEGHGETTLVASDVDLTGLDVMITPLAEEVEGMRVRTEAQG